MVSDAMFQINEGVTTHTNINLPPHHVTAQIMLGREEQGNRRLVLLFMIEVDTILFFFVFMILNEMFRSAN